MSKSKPKPCQLDWKEEQSRQLKHHQEKCKHKFKTFQLLDFLNDEIIYESFCLKCGSPA